MGGHDLRRLRRAGPARAGGEAVTSLPKSAPAPPGAPPESVIRERFTARMLGALGEVVGPRAGIALLQYMTCEAVGDLLDAGLARPRGMTSAIAHVAHGLGLGLRTVAEGPDRFELEALEGPFEAFLPAEQRAALLRGLFQGILAHVGEGSGWGVLVAESAEPIRITLTRGIA